MRSEARTGYGESGLPQARDCWGISEWELIAYAQGSPLPLTSGQVSSYHGDWWKREEAGDHTQAPASLCLSSLIPYLYDFTLCLSFSIWARVSDAFRL